MKAIKFANLLALALIFTLAATGCKKTPVGTTPLPGMRPGPVGDTRPRPLPPGPRMTGDEGVTSAIAQNPDWSPDDPNLVRDEATLAANTVHFDFDSAVVKSSEQANVEAAAAALRLDPKVKLLIEGHCDERGTEEYNRSLGERRALALREILVTKLAVDPARVRTVTFGKDQPADRGHNEAAWAKNRRGVFVLFHPKG